jgi:hypothetical protein
MAHKAQSMLPHPDLHFPHPYGKLQAMQIVCGFQRFSQVAAMSGSLGA